MHCYASCQSKGVQLDVEREKSDLNLHVCENLSSSRMVPFTPPGVRCFPDGAFAVFGRWELAGMSLILDQLGLNARSLKDLVALDGALCNLVTLCAEQSTVSKLRCVSLAPSLRSQATGRVPATLGVHTHLFADLGDQSDPVPASVGVTWLEAPTLRDLHWKPLEGPGLCVFLVSPEDLSKAAKMSMPNLLGSLAACIPNISGRTDPLGSLRARGDYDPSSVPEKKIQERMAGGAGLEAKTCYPRAFNEVQRPFDRVNIQTPSLLCRIKAILEPKFFPANLYRKDEQ